MNMNRLIVAHHRSTVGKSFGALLLFAAFDPSTVVMGHKHFPGRLPACKLSLVWTLRRCQLWNAVSSMATASFLWGPLHSSLYVWISRLLYKELAQCLPGQLSPLASSHYGIIQSRAFEQDAESSPDSRGAVKYFCSHDPENAFLLAKGAPSLKANNLGLYKWVVGHWRPHFSSAGCKCIYEIDPACFPLYPIFLYFFYCLDNMDIINVVEIFWIWPLPPYLESF